MNKLTRTELRAHILTAADLIEEHGHAQKVLRDTDHSLCLTGAFNLALVGNPNPERTPQVKRYQRQFAHALGFFCINEAMAWNDVKWRRESAVIARLHRAADRLAPVTQPVTQPPKVMAPSFRGPITVTRKSPAKTLVRS